MKIYTRSGDRGETGLYTGQRVPKHHARVLAYGDVDELNAWLGLVRSEDPADRIAQPLTQIQATLFELGADLATPLDAAVKHPPRRVTLDAVQALERLIDGFDSDLPPLDHFILPAGTRCAALLHIARTVCRRAERAVTRLAAEQAVNPHVLAYLNRLSDLLFTLARYANHSADRPDEPWLPSPS